MVILALTVVLFKRTPQAFIPSEDKGFFAIAVQLPDGASKQRTEAVVGNIEQFLMKDDIDRHAEQPVRRRDRQPFPAGDPDRRRLYAFHV